MILFNLATFYKLLLYVFCWWFKYYFDDQVVKYQILGETCSSLTINDTKASVFMNFVQ